MGRTPECRGHMAAQERLVADPVPFENNSGSSFPRTRESSFDAARSLQQLDSRLSRSPFFWGRGNDEQLNETK
jgi:hypothetical protein